MFARSPLQQARKHNEGNPRTTKVHTEKGVKPSASPHSGGSAQALRTTRALAQRPQRRVAPCLSSGPPQPAARGVPTAASYLRRVEEPSPNAQRSEQQHDETHQPQP